MNREPIYTALFNLLRAAPGIVTASRRLKLWSKVDPSEQPALFMSEQGEIAATTTGLSTTWAGMVDVHIYVRCGPDGPGPALNPILDWIEAAIAPPVGLNRTTMGGLVQHVRIEGEIMKDGGMLDGQAVAIVPIKFLAVG